MTKTDAIEIFGSVEELRLALGLHSRQAIYMWPDELDIERTQRVIGAAVQAGKSHPSMPGHQAPARSRKAAA